MLKNISQLELTISDKVYRFICDNDSPLEHIKEVLFQFTKYVGQIEDAIKAQQQAQNESKLPTSDLPVTDEVKHEEAA